MSIEQSQRAVREMAKQRDPVAEAAGDAFNNTFYKCRAEVSMDWWQRIWRKACAWAWANPPTEYGWLIENGKHQGAGLAYRCIDNDAGGVPAWTEDPGQALRFARRQDAEQYAHHDEDAWRIVEHAWHGGGVRGRELPDAIRVPLDELEADARYLAARLANGTMAVSVGAEAIQKRTRAIREALLAAGVLGMSEGKTE